MNPKLYNAIISHANTNIKTVGRSLFNELELIDLKISELSEANNIEKYVSIDCLFRTKDSVLRNYARKNNLI